MYRLPTAYLARLDHLRLYAALLVVMFHFFHVHHGDLKAGNPLISLVDEGHTGIGLFMVISGFIFTVIAGSHEVRWWPFLRNRLIRIYPLFVFAVFLSLLISTYNDHRNFGGAELLGWLLPFRSSTVPFSPYFVQLWTIWVEFQFYLLFPFLHAFAQRYGDRYLLALIGLLIVLRALVFINTGSVRYLAYETIFGRLDEFLLGMLAARLYLRRPGVAAGPWHLFAAALAVLLTLHLFSRAAGFTDMDHPIWIVWTTIEGLVWAWLLLAYVNCRWKAPGPLERGLAHLGVLSFSIYVMHNLLIPAFNKTVGVLAFKGFPVIDTLLTGALAVVPLVVVLACATYWLIEKPFLSLRGNYLAGRETGGNR